MRKSLRCYRVACAVMCGVLGFGCGSSKLAIALLQLENNWGGIPWICCIRSFRTRPFNCNTPGLPLQGTGFRSRRVAAMMLQIGPCAKGLVAQLSPCKLPAPIPQPSAQPPAAANDANVALFPKYTAPTTLPRSAMLPSWGMLGTQCCNKATAARLVDRLHTCSAYHPCNAVSKLNMSVYPCRIASALSLIHI